MAGFQKAERRKVWLKLAITGASGSGKTYGALELAKGLGQKIAMIDTENRSGSLYAHIADYDTLDVQPPFTTEKYIDGIKEAVKGGYDVLIIDSITHAWAGEGGLLAQKELLDQRGGNQYANWRGITKKHEEFKSAFLQAPIHVICTMRSKEEYAQMTDQNGKASIKKMGSAPIQREGMTYEFTTVFDVDSTHHAAVSKDRTDIFKDAIFKISAETGKRFVDWLASGKEPLPEQVEEPAAVPVEAPEPAKTNGAKPPTQTVNLDPIEINAKDGNEEDLKKAIVVEIKEIARQRGAKLSELVSTTYPGKTAATCTLEELKKLLAATMAAVKQADEKATEPEAQEVENATQT